MLDALTRAPVLHLDECEPEQLAAFAHKAFLLGMTDGMQRKSPRDSRTVVKDVLPPLTGYRIFHRLKLRQVYGAGFDVARGAHRVNELVTTDSDSG